jgi:hypothetical protein
MIRAGLTPVSQTYASAPASAGPYQTHREPSNFTVARKRRRQGLLAYALKPKRWLRARRPIPNLDAAKGRPADSIQRPWKKSRYPVRCVDSDTAADNT